jgi:hypothetical protein
MAAPTLQELLRRVGRVEHAVARQGELLNKFAAQFAWYYVSERVRLFAVVTSLNKATGTANLVVFWDGWSGGSDVKVDTPMYVENPLDPDRPREGKFEPMLDFGDLLSELARMAQESTEKEADETSPEPAAAS